MTNLRMKQFLCWVAVAAVSPSAEFITGQAARMVIGQRTFTAQESTLGADKLGGVGGLAYANNTLFVADANRIGSSPVNHRVLIFRNIDQTTLPVNALVPQGTRCPACRGTADTVLGQADFDKNEVVRAGQNTLRSPTAVASDGVRLVVADTDNNRVLVWNSIPTSNGQGADLVLGQENFTTFAAPPRGVPGQRMRGPHGVWIQGNRLFVADSGHSRVLIWNNFPTSNGQAADIVIGQPDFNTFIELDLARTTIDPKQDNLLNPVSVTSDGQRMFVSDLGQNRVLIWNSIPTQSGQPADLVLGQPDFTSALANNSSKLCESNGIGADGNPSYPFQCLATMDFPRFALSDGTKLFIADGGNDRILVYSQLPTTNGQPADIVLGQAAGDINRSSDSAYPLYRSAADLLRTPLSLAWDGTNLYVSDTYNRRVVVFSEHDTALPYTAVRNLASRDVFATGSILFDGTLTQDTEITLTISGLEYKYKLIRDDTFANVLTQFAQRINNDPAAAVTASIIPDLRALLLTAREGGVNGNSVTFSTSYTPTTATIVMTTSGATLVGGQDAAQVAAGTLVTVYGEGFSTGTVSAPENATELPRELAGVRLYVDGIEAPLLMVSPAEIHAQLPWEIADSTSANAYVRIERENGVITTSPVSVAVIPQNPGIFAFEGQDPRPGILQHFSDRATGTVSVDGSINVGDIATVVIEDREYSYTVMTDDTLGIIRDKLIQLINDNPDEKVEAYSAGVFTRIRLRAKEAGEAGNGLVYSAKSNEGAQVIMTPTTPALCCANTQGALITEENPALPGETIVVTATGLGALKNADQQALIQTGLAFDGPSENEPAEFVSSLAGGKTANVLYAALKPGAIGLYEVHLELNSDLPTNSKTQVTIAQDIYVSNVVTFALKNPADEATDTDTDTDTVQP